MAMEAQSSDVAQPFAAARTKFEEIVAVLQSQKAAEMTHSEVERQLHKDGTELLRQMYQAFLDVQGDGRVSGPVQGSDGVERGHVRIEKRNLMSLFGPVRVLRAAYGAPETKPLRPLDAELNLPKRLYSFPVQQRVAEEASKVAFEETVRAVASTSGATVPKRQAEELVVHAAQDFEAFYVQAQQEARRAVDQTSSIVVITTDGKGVVMRTEDLREGTRKRAQARGHKMATRRSKGEKSNSKRMAQVAAVYTVAPFVRAAEDVLLEMRAVRDVEKQRPRPEHKRVWASLKRTPGEIIEQAYAEASSRDPRREKTWAVLVDGNRDQMKLVKQSAKDLGVEVTFVVDFIHALEYVWKAGRALLGEVHPKLEGWVRERALRLLNNEASQVAAAIRRAGTCKKLRGWRRKATNACANYLLSNKDAMRYADYLRRGLPIATGVIEGACRYLVKDRMDVTGARWRLDRSEAVLQLRALRASGDFADYWAFHEEQESCRNHRLHYARQQVPSTHRCHRQSAPASLRVVK